mmetsp:Transcript_33390/g.51228  ORF Transcript_33390/g.51228 Transcript_33390/m.51228 type:complete len:83 (+) Transcript_33390:1081-1329(+)
MKKIKLERSMKLRKEDFRERDFNILSNKQEPENNWLNSFGNQKQTYFPAYEPKIKTTHTEKQQIASAMTSEDKANEALRVKI